MKFKSNLLSQASGSAGGTTFAHNQGGLYFRNRSVPVNPNSPAQQAVRTALKQLSTRWQNALTSAQRAAWATYAKNVPLTNTLGDTRPINALSMYVRCNSPLLYAAGAGAVIDDGPTTFALATFSAPTIAVASGDIELHFNNTDDWATATGGRMYVYASVQQSPTINFFKGPFLYKQSILGNTTTPPTSPVQIGVEADYASGNRIFYRFRVSDADARLSSDMILAFDIP